MPTIDEKELEDFLTADFDRLCLIGCEVGQLAKVYRQFHLGSYGTADIVTIDPEQGPDGIWFNVRIIELKRGEVDGNTLSQACRYCAGFRHHWSDYWDDGVGPKIFVTPVLVGSHLNQSEWVYTGDYMSPISVFTYSISLDSGIAFEEVGIRGFRQTKPQFSPKFEHVVTGAMEAFEELRVLIEEIHSQKILPAPIATTVLEEVIAGG